MHTESTLARTGRALFYAAAALLMASVIWALLAQPASAINEPNLSVALAPAIGDEPAAFIDVGESTTYRARIRNSDRPGDPAGTATNVKWFIEMTAEYGWDLTSVPSGTNCVPLEEPNRRGILCTTATLAPNTTRTVVFELTRIIRYPDGSRPLTISVLDPATLQPIIGPIRETSTLN